MWFGTVDNFFTVCCIGMIVNTVHNVAFLVTHYAAILYIVVPAICQCEICNSIT